VWYVAIDFQLYAVLVFFSWASQKLGKVEFVQPGQALLLLACAMAVASLWWWNRNSGHDEWAWYFFGAYGVGVLACWAQREGKTLPGSVILVLLIALALWIEWRERLVLTGLTALLLMHSSRLENTVRKIVWQPVRWLGDVSYSVFLIHYGVAVLASSVVIALSLKGSTMNGVAFLLTWVLSIAAGWALYHWVESR
jgi:peptidoglycan/LPS O-acetylase OafA/YrhL